MHNNDMNKTMDDNDEKPLDPAVERVRRKLVRLMVASIAITMILLFAVLIGVIYKVMRPVESAQLVPPPLATETMPTKPIEKLIALAPGSRLISQSLSGDMLSVAIRKENGESEILIINYRLGEVVSRLLLPTEQDGE